MGCGASVDKWITDEESAWATTAGSLSFVVQCSWHSSTSSEQASYFTVTLTGASGVALTVRGKATGTADTLVEGEFISPRPEKFTIEFDSAAGGLHYDARTKALRRGDTSTATCANADTHWAWTVGGGVLPEAITVMKAKGDRVLVTSGSPQAPRDGLLATMAGVPFGTTKENGDRQLMFAASPVVGALPPTELALFLAMATCGCWRAAAYGSAHTGSTGCYGYSLALPGGRLKLGQGESHVS